MTSDDEIPDQPSPNPSGRRSSRNNATEVTGQLRLMFGRPTTREPKPTKPPVRIRRTHDLLRWYACQHAAETQLRITRKLLEQSEAFDDKTQLLIDLGNQHEHTYARIRRELERARGRAFVEIFEDPSRMADPRVRRREIRRTTLRTRNAVNDPAVGTVYQGVLADERDTGLLLLQHPDFIIRGDDGPSVLDTKLARRPKPQHLIQAGIYADGLAQISTDASGAITIRLGDDTDATYDADKTAAIRRRLVDRYDHWDQSTLGTLASQQISSYPLPNEHCSVCEFSVKCDDQWRNDDHLSLVAGMTTRTRAALERAGITTVAALATSTDEVPGVQPDTLTRLRQQAQLDVKKREADQRQAGHEHFFFRLNPPTQPYVGLSSLPAPSVWDVYLDFESDSQFGVNPLIYLMTRVTADPVNGTTNATRTRWSHSYAQEREAFVELVNNLTTRHQKHPDAHVYHYAAFEPTQLLRLAQQHQVLEDEVQQLIDDGLFVDLYRVLRQSMQISLDAYDQKSVETALGIHRSGPITSGDDALVAYQNWLRGRNRTDEQLQYIETYAVTDATNLMAIHRQLIEIRQLWVETYQPTLDRQQRRLLDYASYPDRRAETPEPQPATQSRQLREEIRALVQAIDEAAARAGLPDEHVIAYRALAGALEFHGREYRLEWQRHQDRLRATPQELFEDSEAIALLELLKDDSVVQPTRGSSHSSVVWHYAFDPQQESKLEIGDDVIDPVTARSAGRIVALDLALGRVALQRDRSSNVPHPTSIIPQLGPSPQAMQRALVRLARNVIETGWEKTTGFAVEKSILLRELPPTTDITALDHLDGHALVIQGPPGSGKTTLAATIIESHTSQRDGRRVAIVANSHAAITNVVDRLADQLTLNNRELFVWQRGRKSQVSTRTNVRSLRSNDEAVNVVATNRVRSTAGAGTKWVWSDPRLHKQLDLLVVDEASQVALPDLLAAAQCAKNVVIVGDPQQLQGVTAAHHHGGVERSCINWLIGQGQPTVTSDRGIFLDTTYRLGPDVAQFCSETMYDGKLRNAPATSATTLRLPSRMHRSITGSGLRLVTVDHEGNRTSSLAEVNAVAQIVQQLVGQTWRDGINRQRRLSARDIIVTTPFNAHRILLEQHLRHHYPDIRIGTVDKMQGQEAPVVIYSTAISDPTEAPKGPEFVLDNNRLNVAISRAQGLAVLVTSRALLDHKPKTVEQLYLHNALARFEELASPVTIQQPVEQRVALRPRTVSSSPSSSLPHDQIPMQFTRRYAVSLSDELGPEL